MPKTKRNVSHLVRFSVQSFISMRTAVMISDYLWTNGWTYWFSETAPVVKEHENVSRNRVKAN